MNRGIALVEGQTEQGFIRDVLAPHLFGRGVSLVPMLVGKGSGSGGVPRYSAARKELTSLLKKDSGIFVTTMFDFYAMPPDWPGRRDAMARGTSSQQRAASIESAIGEDVCEALGSKFARERFVPYVQMHEFEALLFTDPDTMSEVFGVEHRDAFAAIAETFESPEDIDDSPLKAPSKRIEAIVPRFAKPVLGPQVAARIGIERLRTACPHFAAWVARLEDFAPPPS